MITRLIDNVGAHPAAWVIIGVVAIVCGLADLRARRMHHVITVPFFAASLLWALVLGGLVAGNEIFSAMVLGLTPIVVLLAMAYLPALARKVPVSHLAPKEWRWLKQ